MDSATGLLYVGNGQYYDPATGRFLTRDVNPNSTNPYVPWGDPTGALLAPLALVALIYGRKKKKSKFDTLVIVLFVAVGVGMGLSACAPANPPSTLPSSPQPPSVPPANPSVPIPTSTLTPSPTSTPTPTPAPNFVPEASAWNYLGSCGCSVWNFSQWETIPGLTFEHWLVALRAYGHYCNVDPSEQNVFWPEENRLSLRLILAHNIIKEFGDMLIYADHGNYKRVREAQEEAYGRQYWQHCGPNGCFITNGIADSRLISFLSGSESWRKSAEGINDIIVGGFGPKKREKALNLADRILNPTGSDYAWKNGKEPNKPFHYGFISNKFPPSPRWLVQFLNSGKSGEGDHEYVASYVDEQTNILLFVLTPNQANALCGNKICVRVAEGDPPPDWLR